MEPTGTGAPPGAVVEPLERDDDTLEGTSLGELARGLCGDLSGDCQTPWPPLLLSARLLRLQP